MKLKTETNLSSKATLSNVPKAVIHQLIAHPVIAGSLDKDNKTRYLTAADQAEFFSTSMSLFAPTKRSRNTRILKKFLECVALGQQEKAEALLRYSNPSQWLLGVGEFSDYSGRTFRCSAYEYAYWAKDTHMRRMLEHYMDDVTSALILKRINKMEQIDKATGQKIGLTYSQHGTTHRSAHVDLTPLKQAQKAFVDGYDGWSKTHNWDALRAAWLAIGKTLRNAPAHVVNEYCRPDRSFHPLPQFNEPTLPRVLTFYNWSTIRTESWFPLAAGDSGLGFDFSITRRDGGKQGAALGGELPLGLAAGDWVAVDLAAVTRLDEVRTAELTQSRDHLNTLTNSLTWLSPALR